jgi:hypothetical protein
MEDFHFRIFTPNPLMGAHALNLIRVDLQLKSPLGDSWLYQKNENHIFQVIILSLNETVLSAKNGIKYLT